MEQRIDTAVLPRVTLDSDIPVVRFSNVRGTGIGWAVGIATFYLDILILQAIVRSSVMQQFPVQLTIFGPIILFLGMPILMGLSAAAARRAINRRELREIALRSARVGAINEALRTTEMVRATIQDADRIVRELPQLLARADRELDAAKNDYSERAYSPFWDCVARVAELLGTYQSRIHSLTALGRKYTQLLAEREHTFPKTMLLAQPIPNPKDQIVHLADVTRMAQRDFQFAVIWEHHKTRRVLIAGFSTLETALVGLETALVESLHELRNEFCKSLDEATTDLDKSIRHGSEQVFGGLQGIANSLEKETC
jgi:hypothetical protein